MNTHSSRPLVSIILPVYNREKYVSKAIEGVLSQTFDNYELVIVDDGSTDGSKAVVEQYLNDSRVKYYYQENSGKPSIARNRGIEKASGEWLAFIDSDDCWFADKLEKQVALVDECHDRNQRIDLVLGDYKVVNNGQLEHASFFETYGVWDLLNIGEKNKYQHGYLFEQKQMLSALYSRGFAATQAVMVRKSLVIELGGFDDSLTFAEDNDLWMTIAEHGNVGLVNGPVYEYHIHGENITSGVNSNFYTDTINILNKHVLTAKSIGVNTLPLKRRLGFYRLGLAELYMSNGQFMRAINIIICSIPFMTNISNIRMLMRCFKAIFKKKHKQL